MENGKNEMQKNTVALLVGYKNGRKVCEHDITHLTTEEIALIVQNQQMQGRTWSYEGTNLQKMKERREGKC